MKKIFIYLLSCIFAVSFLASIYCALQYNQLVNRAFRLIRSEIDKRYPELGYSFIGTFEGSITQHPDLSWTQDKTIPELFAPDERSLVTNALLALKDKKEILIPRIKDVHGHTLQLYLCNKNGTVHGLLFFPDELKKFVSNDERDALILLSLSIVAALCALLLLLGIFSLADHNGWWVVVTFISLILFIELAFLWSLRYTVGFQEEYQRVPILTQAQESHFIQKLEAASGKEYHVVPTGIFVERMQFSPRGNSIYPGLYLNGTIWQKYDKKKHAKLDRGFIIPNAQNITVSEIYRQDTGTQEVVGWSFSAILYQRFKPTLYPFDHRHIIINLLHKNFEKNVILTPDLESYTLLNPLTLPGIAYKKMSYWNLTSSFFHLKQYDFGTTLGSAQLASATVPYLQFLITAERKLGGDFLMYLVTLALIFIIVFILLLAFLKQEVFKELVGFSTIGVLSVCCGLLFVLITSEIDLRHTLVTEGVVYLEFLYFVCYLTILGVIVDGILFATKTNLPLIQYENNLVCKLLYWPSVLLSIVLITAYAIY